MASANAAADKFQWQIRDVIVAVIVIVLLHVLAAAVVRSPSYLVARALDILIDTVVIYFLFEKYPLKLLFLADLKIFMSFVSLGTLCCLFINFPFSIWSGTSSSLPEEYSLFVHYSTGEKVVFLLFLSVLAPAVQEIVFRGFFYRILRNRYDVFWGAAISTLLYALSHGTSSEVLYYIFIPGLIYVFVYEKTSSILASTLTHSLNNTLWFVFTCLGAKVGGVAA